MRYHDIIAEKETKSMEIDPRQLAKAEAEGFDTGLIYYHGTKRRFTKFKLPDKRGFDELGRGVYVTTSIVRANVWAQGTGSILACVLKPGPLIELSDLPKGQQWYGGEKWEEVFRGYNLYLEKEFGPDSALDYRTFAERVNRREISLGDAYGALGYIGATHRYSQISDQVVVWDPMNVKIVGKMAGIDGYLADHGYED